MRVEELLAACRAPADLAPADAGLWYIRGLRCPAWAAGHFGLEPLGRYTALFRWTDATIHRSHGDVVMEDSPRELRRHLPILLAARGRVLLSGLGLGCVVRGLLAKPEVEHVDVVEIDRTVIDLVGREFRGDPRVTIHHGNAVTYPWPHGSRWDYAWHDVWTDRGSLDVLHFELLARYRHRVGRQGAWGLERWQKRVWPEPLLGGARRAA